MLGQPVSMLIPRVVGFKLTGEIPPGATATDVVLTITEMLRRHGVVGKFVEFYGEGVGAVPLANRATIGNMSPEFGSTAAIFPIDEETVELPAAHRPLRPSRSRWSRPTPRSRASGTTRPASRSSPRPSSWTCRTVVPSIAGPKRPQDRIELSDAKQAFRTVAASTTPDRTSRSGRRRSTRPVGRRGGRGVLPGQRPGRARRPVRGRGRRTGRCSPPPRAPTAGRAKPVTGHPRRRRVLRARPRRRRDRLDHLLHQHVQPVGDARRRAAGQERRRPGPRGQAVGEDRRWRPARKVVTDYYEKAGLWPYLEKLGYHLVGYGCTTCIGNSGPLPEEISAAVNEADLTVVSVLSGNRNFEGRINPDVKMNYLASPAAGDRLRARRHDGLRLRRPSRWAPDPDGSRGLPAATSGRRPQDVQATIDCVDQRGDVHQGLRRRLRRRRALAVAADARGQDLRVGPGVDLRPQAPVLRRHGAGARRRSPTSPAPGCWPSSATR